MIKTPMITTNHHLKGQVGSNFCSRETQKEQSCTPIKWCFVSQGQFNAHTHAHTHTSPTSSGVVISGTLILNLTFM